MAIVPLSNDSADPTRPFAAHPAFPVVVALWFAVLCGLGALILPERFVPPLAASPGLSARELVALVATGIGALGGFALARLVAPGSGEGAGFDEPAIRPLNVREELDWPEPEPPIPATGLPPPEPEDADLSALVERLRTAIDLRRARMAAPTPLDHPAAAVEAAAPELAARAGADFFARPDEAPSRRPLPEAANAGPPAEDADTALRASLARLRRLRGAA